MIGLNDFRRQWDDTRADATAAFEQFGESGWYILGQGVAEFERNLAAYWPLPHAVGVASGLDAIEIGLRILGCKAGDRVLTTPLSAFATTLAIVRLGAAPVFVDVDASGLIDLGRCREALTRRPDIRFLLPVHLYGHALDAEQLRGLQDAFGVELLEDCAQSIGARSYGRAAGTTGRIAATSFYPTKNLGALGDAGALLTSSEEFAQQARVLRDYGQSRKYWHAEVGYNSRLDELQARLMSRAALPRLPQWTAARQRIAARYRTEIDNSALELPPVPEGSESVWHLFPVLAPAGEKAAFMQYMRERGIVTGEHYPYPITEQPALQGVEQEVLGELPMTKLFCERQVSLPIHPYLTEQETDAVIRACREWRP